MDAGKLIIKIDGDNSGLKQSLQGIDALGKIGLAGLTAAVGALAAGFGYAVKVGSDFEAQMSTVGAISGASAEDMGRLTEKAKEMGIISAFSATEAGQAFEFMAQAGWKTEQMLGGIEGVMNLAAASGEDLAMSASIVTDGLTAFGLSAEESGRFADVLAVAAAASNTNVAMLGESFKYVAPIAGSLGYTIEDTSVALGLMANSGIKSTQAGTALRSILSRLVNPTKQSADAMKDLGISVTDIEGNMKPLNVLLGDLRNSFNGLTTEQKASYASMLGGQEALSGLLAIVNASESDFDNLTSAIANSSGEAKKMAELRLDNLKGQVTLLKSSFEGAGIAVYEKFSEPMKDGVKSAITSVNMLTRNISGGGLGSAIEGLGKSVGNLIADFAKFATKALPPLIDGFSWLIENLGALTRTVVVAVAAFKTFTIISSVSKLVHGFSATLSAYSIATAAAAAGSTAAASAQVFMTASMTAGEIIMGVLTGKITLATAAQWLFNSALLANPAGLMVAAISALCVALAVWVATSDQATEEEKARQQAIDETIQKTNELTDAVKKQQEAYQQNMDTIVENADVKLLELDKTEALAKELEGLADANGKVADKDKDRANFILNELNEALDTEYKMTGNQIDNYAGLTDEVYKLIDAEKARAISQAYQEMLTESIKHERELKKQATEATRELMEQEAARAQVIEDVRQKLESVTGQIVSQQEAEEALSNAQYIGSQGVRVNLDEEKKRRDELNDSINKNKEIVEQHGQAMVEVDELEKESSQIKTELLAGNYEAINDAARFSAESRLNTLKQNNGDVLAEIDTNNAEISKLEQLMNEAQSEAQRASYESMLNERRAYGEALLKEQQSANATIETQQLQHLEKTIQAQKKSLDDQLTQVKGNKEAEQQVLKTHYTKATSDLEHYSQEYLKGTEGYTLGGLKLLEEHTGSMEVRYKESMGEIVTTTETSGKTITTLSEKTGQNSVNALVGALNAGKPAVGASGGGLGSAVNSNYSSNVGAESLGRNTVDGVISGLAARLDSLRAMGASMANAVNGAFKAALDINSPSRVMQKDGQNAGEGAVLGVADMIPKMIATAGKLANGFRESFEDEKDIEFQPEITISEKFFGSGVDSAKEFARGFNGEFNKMLMSIQTRINATLASATPHVAVAGGYGGNRTIDNSKTITQAPTLVFNEPVDSPDVVARRVNSVFRYGLAGER